ncbi:hypothetical protein ABZ619_38950 [Streptomyces sp. NPDC007851]|uniref:hypothetical protein n=1 Tax=Streptomyces sp. NPDC007851 TaxID=3155008 RepID=UPI0033EA55F3
MVEIGSLLLGAPPTLRLPYSLERWEGRNVADQDEPLLEMDEVAALIGVEPATMRTYNSRAKRRRAAGTATPADLPEPDRMWGKTPSWYRSTIERWRQDRANQPNVRDVPPAAE